MSSLFNTLNARFAAPSLAQAIRPRPMLRFENSAGGSDGWGETSAELIGQSVEQTHTQPPSKNSFVINKEAQADDKMAQKINRAFSTSKTDEKQRSSWPVQANKTDNPQRPSVSVQSKPIQIEQHTTEHVVDQKEQAKHRMEIQPVKQAPSDNEVFEQDNSIGPFPPTNTRAVETIDNPQSETVVAQSLSEQVSYTEKPLAGEPLSEASLESNETQTDRPIDAQSSTTTRVHIGRIDVRMPTPPVHSVAVPAKRRSMSNGSTRGSSALTDYLGWKR